MFNFQLYLLEWSLRTGRTRPTRLKCSPKRWTKAMKQKRLQSEFLTLAGWWLVCRYRVLGHQVADLPHAPADWPGALQGMEDSAAEMRLLLLES
jgi:hypothetical protein